MIVKIIKKSAHAQIEAQAQTILLFKLYYKTSKYGSEIKK